ncbi:MAG: RNA polymerase sigma-70 factor [Ekhidna sp.]|nr:RNA polymerase sigma-70 factor [Ekhidna sp.]
MNRATFETHFDTFFHPLCAFGYRFIADAETIQDLVQSVFISFWDQRGNFENEKAVKSFLYTSVKNKCLNHLKHLSVRQKHEEQLIYELESTELFNQQVIEEDTFNLLYQEIEKLPQSAKKIMLLALKGLKNKEIAETLGISENTVKTQKKIAYSKLKDKLSKTMLNFLFLQLKKNSDVFHLLSNSGCFSIGISGKSWIVIFKSLNSLPKRSREKYRRMEQMNCNVG